MLSASATLISGGSAAHSSVAGPRRSRTRKPMGDRVSHLRTRLTRGETVFGTFASIPSPSVVSAIGRARVDFIVIDAEHGPVSMETAEELCMAAESQDLAPLIRVAANDATMVLRALDIGAEGVHIPHVESVDRARAAVAHAKYFPLGSRGYTPFTRAGGYGEEATRHAERTNDRTLVVIHIEGKAGIDNVDEIAKVEHLDVLFVGPFDLSQSLGIPGDVEDPRVIAAIRRTVDAAQRNGLACGSYARDERYLTTLRDCGVRYITYLVDTAAIVRTYRDAYARFRQAGAV